MVVIQITKDIKHFDPLINNYNVSFWYSKKAHSVNI